MVFPNRIVAKRKKSKNDRSFAKPEEMNPPANKNKNKNVCINRYRAGDSTQPKNVERPEPSNLPESPVSDDTTLIQFFSPLPWAPGQSDFCRQKQYSNLFAISQTMIKKSESMLQNPSFYRFKQKMIKGRLP